MITFDLRALVVDGSLGGARAGMTRAAIRAVLGEPDEWSFQDPVEQAGIWRYGRFEIHFDDDVAWLLFTDYLHDLDPGPGRAADAWLVEPDLTVAEVQARLDRAGLAHQLVDDEPPRVVAGLGTLDFRATATGPRLAAISVLRRDESALN